MPSYNEIDALNWSSLKHISKSPLEYRWRIDHPEPPKTHYIIGNAIHTLVLEPEKFDKRYALCEVRRDKRTAKFKAWLDDHPKAEPLNAKEWDNAQRAAAAVLSHPVAFSALEPCRNEEPLTWTDPDTGLKCKGRVDGITPEYVADLKTTTDPSPRKFTRDAAAFMYHGQLAFYHYGAVELKKIDGKTMPFVIACAKDAPFDVAVYKMKPDDLYAGRQLVLSLMRKLEECVAADMWPGCAPDLQYLELPGWAPGLQTELEEEQF